MVFSNGFAVSGALAGGAVGGTTGIIAAANSDNPAGVMGSAGVGSAIGATVGGIGAGVLPNFGEAGKKVGTGLAKGLFVQPAHAYMNSFKTVSGNGSLQTAVGSLGIGSGMAGAGIGMYFGNKFTGGDGSGALTGAAIGGAAGLAAPLALGATSAAVGFGGMALLKNSGRIMSGVGSVGIGTALGSAATAGHLLAPKTLKGTSFDPRTGNALARGVKRAGYFATNPVQKYAKFATGVAGKMFKYENASAKLNSKGKMVHTPGRMRLSKLGLGVGAVGMLIASGTSATKDYLNRSGSPSGASTPTPKPYSYVDNGGATGDLVFAMHNNRN